MKGFWLCTAASGYEEQAGHGVWLISKDWLINASEKTISQLKKIVHYYHFITLGKSRCSPFFAETFLTWPMLQI